MNQIILASQSKNRKMIMDSLGIPYSIIPADVDEKSIHGASAGERVKKVARAKAEKIAKDYPDAIIIAGDSYAVNNGKSFEKPETLEEAKKMLLEQSGGKGMFYVGFCYLDKAHKIDFSTTVEVHFELRKFSEEEVDKYVREFPVLNWSGGLSPHHPEGAAKVKKINGSFTAYIYGIPLELIVENLQKSGVISK